MTLDSLIRKYRDFIVDDPFIATNMGLHEKDHEVSDLSEAHAQKRLRGAKALLQRVDDFPRTGVTFDQTIDLQLMSMALQKIILLAQLSYNGLSDRAQKPQIGSALVDAFLYLFLKDPRTPAIRLEAIASRLHKIPEMIAGYQPVLKRPIGRWKAMEQEQLQGMPEMFASIVAWAEHEGFQHMETLKAGVGRTSKAIADYLSFLDTLPPGDDFRVGPEVAQKLAWLNGIDLDLDEIHQLAKSFFRDLDIRISELVARLKRKYTLAAETTAGEVLDHVKELFAVDIENVVGLYESEQARVMEFIRQTGLFVLPDSQKLLILKTPTYLVPTIPVGAMFPPAPFEQGPRTSVVYVTIDEGRRRDQNALMITNTMIHEGIPGHHLQLSFACENHSTVRRLADYYTHAEGWTTYLEGFMSEAGFIDPEIIDEYLLVALSDFARLGARVGIDLFFMTGNDTYLDVMEGFRAEGDTVFEKAKSLLRKATGFTDPRCEGELNWYSRERGYPMSYLTGNIMARSLKNDLQQKIGDKNSTSKIFHEQYLKQGNMTIPMLRQVLEHQGYL